VLAKIAFDGDAEAAQRTLHGHVHGGPAMGHAAMIGGGAPAVGGRTTSTISSSRRRLCRTNLGGCVSTRCAFDKEIEIAPGVFFPRLDVQRHGSRACDPGDRGRHPARQLRQRSLTSALDHFHGIHPANMDGVFEVVRPGGEFVYEFPAKPAGMQLYHCHDAAEEAHSQGPLRRVHHRSEEPRPPAHELVTVVMNGYDTDGDGANNFYTVNGKSFYYAKYLITVRRSETVRIYLANLTEFDLINSFTCTASSSATSRPERATTGSTRTRWCNARDSAACSRSTSTTPAGSCSTRTSRSSPTSAGWASST
jgi:hypothetical protein